MDIYEAVLKRRAIRRFKDKPVPYDILERCVNAGRLAPSARNRQLCEYIIVDDEQMLPKMFENIGGTAGQPVNDGGPSPVNRAKAYIIILVNSALEAEFEAKRRVTTYDVGLAAENIILVALEQGVGACPVLMFKEPELKQLLQIPESYAIALVLLLGYPDESPVAEEATGSVESWVDGQNVRHVPKRKLADITHRNSFP